MNLENKINLLSELGSYIQTDSPALEKVKHQAYIHNKWFTKENISKALAAISQHFLQKDKLTAWLQDYPIVEDKSPKKVALVLAGNIPLVGFHDILSVFLAGHQLLIKLSEKDKFLIPFLTDWLVLQAPELKSCFNYIERLNKFDAVIATGSNNSARYFEAYFGKYPNIIRKNRSSIAILDGKESSEDLAAFGKDVFDYFGLGCRNVSKVYLPEGFNFDPMLEALHEYKEIVLHDKYKNNFDYNYTLYILNKIKYRGNGCILMTEEETLQSRIACLHYEYYKDEQDLQQKIAQKLAEIQCIVSTVKLEKLSTIAFGKAQQPTLTDYADGVDTMQFLLEI